MLRKVGYCKYSQSLETNQGIWIAKCDTINGIQVIHGDRKKMEPTEWSDADFQACKRSEISG